MRLFFIRTIVVIGFFLLTQATWSKSIVVVGDSLSAAYGIPLEQGWVALLQKRLSENGFDYTVINESISGETTDGGLRRFPGILERTQPEIVILELGANDGLRGFPIARIKSQLTGLVHLSLSKTRQVLILGMHIPPNYGPVYTQQFHQLFQTVAEEHELPVVPFFLEGIATKPELMQNDGLHPKVEGQAAMLDNVWPHLLPLLEKADQTTKPRN